MADRFLERRHRLRRQLKKAEAQALLVTDFTNVTYLTGFTGDDSYLLVGRDADVIVSDGRYTTQLNDECPGLAQHIRSPGAPMHKEVAKVLAPAKISKLAVEAESMTLAFKEDLAGAVANLEIISTKGLVEELRWIKDKQEIALTRQAIRQAERAFEVLKATLHGEKTEKQVADELEFQMRVFGAKGASFPTIVAAGANAALPHARPGQQIVASSPVLLVDWGADGGLYKSDLTRVLLTGKISPEVEKVYRVVLSAQIQAIAAIGPGVKAVKVDRIARKAIERAGYGEYFNHGLGHGVGLQIHEAPRMNPPSQAVLQTGMIVTVEPGVYLPGRFGIRIEDDVLVTDDGCEVLTGVPKQLEDAVVRID